ncbi:MAG TPA: SMI1/KNR4 family protein [Calditrichia bacterium]|nr:SMI1/KNR4 family protein [Calditrichota bacterium]HQU70850.1 SMI1/KNR4 family protein [Calditrichia bacterium]HQV31925.1 SMI1/KNR4 family protein [Calditrichia bacterium]
MAEQHPIMEILHSGASLRILDPQREPLTAEVRRIEKRLQFTFPESYRDFVAFGGLNELAFSNAILSPIEILKEKSRIADRDLIPFASNGFGDFYCWRQNDQPEPPVYFWDHDGGNATPVTGSFTEWLRASKR